MHDFYFSILLWLCIICHKTTCRISTWPSESLHSSFDVFSAVLVRTPCSWSDMSLSISRMHHCACSKTSSGCPNAEESCHVKGWEQRCQCTGPMHGLWYLNLIVPHILLSVFAEHTRPTVDIHCCSFMSVMDGIWWANYHFEMDIVFRIGLIAWPINRGRHWVVIYAPVGHAFGFPYCPLPPSWIPFGRVMPLCWFP